MSVDVSCCPFTFQLGIDEGDRQARIEAFGAIRRAAEIAREWDRKLDGYKIVGEELRAIEIRRAIRAAIGSDKA